MTENYTNGENYNDEKVSKYPQIQGILNDAMKHAFKVGEHWATISEPKGEATVKSFQDELEKALDELFVEFQVEL